MHSFILISYFIILIILGFAKRDASKPTAVNDYLLAGRKLSLPGFVITLVSTWYGGIIGIGENTYLYGLQTWTIFGLPYYLFAVFFAFFVQNVHIKEDKCLILKNNLLHSFKC